MLSRIKNFIEYVMRIFIVFITNFLPVKIIRDDKGVPFLYRYHLFILGKDGPGMCIHNFVKSDPERGYHDHPWNESISFILSGRYDERILNKDDPTKYTTIPRNRWTFNFLNGVDTFHRVMVEDGKDVWTLFAFGKRSKVWGMISLDGVYKSMSTSISDTDSGWWKIVKKGLGIRTHLDNCGKIIATVDIIVYAEAEKKVLLIKRGKDPYKGSWAFPGGRIEQKDCDILDAAKRELKEETNITDINLVHVKTIGNSTRDPRGFCLTNVFLARIPEISINGIKAGDDAVDYDWFALSDLPEMAFDHKEIIKEVIN